ncbi:unnamed protein product [Closterium sp. NIES-53]
MIALCQEHRLEHRMKHIALQYFLARELQQRGQLRLAYVATRANTADIFTKALPPGDHQRFATVLGLLALLFLTGLVTTSREPPLQPCAPPLVAYSPPLFLCYPPLAALSLPLCCCVPCALCCSASPRPACCTTMASLRVLAFDHEERPLQFDTWLDDLQLYLLSNSRESVSLFDHTSVAAPAPPAIADSATRKQGAPPPPLLPPTPLLLLLTSLVLWTSGPLLLVQSAAAARARVAGVVAVAAGVVGGAAVQVVGAVEVVAVVGGVAGVGAVTAVGVVAVGLELRVEILEEARGSSSSIEARPRRPSSFRPRWAELLRSGVAILDLDFDAILAAMYALSTSAEVDCYLCVPPDPGIEAATLGTSDSVLPSTAPAEALHTFTLDSGASRYFFRDNTTFTPLSAPVPAGLADPSGGPVLAHSSTVLPCPALPFGSLSSLHLPSFSTNLVSTAALQDAMVTTTTPGGQRVSICTCTQTGRHLATITRRPGSSLYTQVAASAQVSTSGQVAPPCSFRLLSHQTLLRHHRLGHPSLPHLCGMHSRLLVSGLPRSLPPLPPSPAPPCLPCVEGRQRTAPHSSSFPPMTASLQTLHMDVWGPARVSGQGREPYFLLVVHDYTRYTTVFPFRRKGQVVDVLIPWIHAVRLQLREWFRTGLPVLRLHSERGAPQFYHPTSRLVFPSQEVTFDESVPFYRLFPYRSAPPPPPPLFLAPGPHPVDPLPPQGPAPSGVSRVDPLSGTAPVEVAVCSGAAQGTASRGSASEGAEPGGKESEGAGSGGAEPGGAESEGAGFGGAEPGGVEPGGVEPEGVEPGGAEPAGVEPRGAESEGAESGGAEPRGTASSGGPAGASPRLSPRPEPLSLQQLREWIAQRTRVRSGAARAGDSAAGDTGAGGAGVTAGAGVTGDPTEPGAAGGGGARAVGAGAGGSGAGGAGAGGAGAVDPGAGGASGTSGDLTKRHEPASRPASHVRTGRLIPRPRPPPVPGTHAMALRPSSVPLRVPLSPPPESSLPAVPDLESDRARAASPTVSHLLSFVVTDPSFESTAASALVAELVDFAAAHRLVYATALVAASESASPQSVKDIPTPRSYEEAITGPYSSQWKAAMDAEMASWTSTGTYVNVVPPSRANIVDGMWIFSEHSTAFLQGSVHEEIWLRRPPGFTGITLAALGFTPSTADPPLFLRTNTSLPPFYVPLYVDDLVFATADTEALTL